jgi:hypothetical protein
VTTPEADEQAASAPHEAQGQQPPPIAVSPPPPEAPSAESEPSPFPDAAAELNEADATTVFPVVTPHVVAEREVTYVPLAVTIGDGFKFGCGFFLALVVAMLVGFVLLAALFVITGLFGVNLPIGR